MLTPVSTPLQIASNAGNACALTPDPVAPEFLVSLNGCTPPGNAVSQLPESTKAIEAILEHVVTRLNGSLDPIWSPPHGQHAYWLPRSACTAEENERIQAEEEWARWCTELMVGTGYGGVSEYGSADFGDVRFFRAFEDRPGDRAARDDQPLDAAEKARAPNPLVPVKMACQQLCTYAYYSRGIPFDKVMSQGTQPPAYGVTASDNGHLKHLFDGGWDDDPKYANLTEAFGRQKGRMSPGSILGFLPHGATTQTKGSHVAFVLRVAPHVSKAQFFDTGAVLEQGNGSRSKAGVKAPAAAAFNGGNYDDRLFEKVVGVWNSGVPVDCAGFGALSAIPPQKILSGVRTARRARPLGMARLAIFRRTTNKAVQAQDLLYVSPRVWMHDTATDANYYVSRYLWSLRGTPAHENLEVLWQIAHPANQGKDAFAKSPSVSPDHAS